ncbi:MAG: flavin-containing monooxygenase [Sporichthyaceae bacterium]
MPHQKVTADTVLIIGAGFAGLGAAVRLKQAGICDFVILERAAEVGGTWRDNTYPGAACDIPSVLYSYPFVQNPRWSQFYSGSAEILCYIRTIVDRFELAPHIRFGQNVTSLAFDSASGTWTARTASRRKFVARSVVMASGPLANPALPAIRGREDFAGKAIHSARWDHDYDLAGKRVAVIGTGASAIQIIPEVVDVAEQVTVFQRTPGWVLPRINYRTPGWNKALFAAVPAAQSLARKATFWAHEGVALGTVWNSPATTVVERVASAHLRLAVGDPWLRRQLTPDFRAGCKRLLVSNDYYPALQRPNCSLVTWPIARISPGGIRTAAGVEHRLDAIVFATGFDVAKTGPPFAITGVGGRTLASDWARGAYAYKSVNVSGYPNLFFTFGPNSGPGHNSALVFMNAQIEYLVQAIALMQERGIASLDVRPDVEQAYNSNLQKRLGRTTWNSGCQSWYLTPDGFNSTMFPGFATQYTRQLSRVRLEDYAVTARRDREAVTSAAS